MNNEFKCELCGEPMPEGEEMFKFHGYSGPCPKPPINNPAPLSDWQKMEQHLAEAQRAEMSKEWKDLPDLQWVATAQAEEWEIEVHNPTYACWNEWEGTRWSATGVYRGRPKQPKTKQVKMLCWYRGGELIWQDERQGYDGTWKRVPAEDKIVEVEL